ncbi:MAG: indolepyruvate ferredoxin oxidoreductase subunit alpha [Clostridia bacterium]|nr:indolepyruvate ferredoxin oxidoreductase subunit alpha [Clostridia bacterium]
MNKIMIGNEAVARGLYEAGVRVVSSYPGTPSTEITEFAAKFPEVYAEWAPNEKVALETAIGASIGGARSFTGMKHVGLNVAADPLFTVSYTGVNAGLVIAVADDPGMHSSQNEQDSRNYAIGAKVPMLEPSDSGECLAFVKEAYELSEKYDTPVILRLCTRVAHSQSAVPLSERADLPLKSYEKNAAKFVMVPANAKGRHPVVEQRTAALAELANTAWFNRVEYHDKKLGVITAGDCYQYAREALGDSASYLKLGMVNPLPEKLIRDFAASVDRLVVIEELDPVIERFVRSLGIEVEGKSLFPVCGEFSQVTVREALGVAAVKGCETAEKAPVRPPVMCPGCPHRGLFYVLKKLGVYVSGDIGCYTLGAGAPLTAIDTTVCMGASVSAIHGYNKARGAESAKKSVAVIGDSTFMHSGITGLVNIAYNMGNSNVILLDNSITGMTGHQQNPTTGQTLKGDIVAAVDVPALVKAIGIKRVVTVDPYDVETTERVIREELAADEPSFIISKRPCALLKYVKFPNICVVDREKCKSCKACMRIGCPAISIIDGKAQINRELCVGCGVCAQLCKFGAISTSAREG